MAVTKPTKVNRKTLVATPVTETYLADNNGKAIPRKRNLHLGKKAPIGPQSVRFPKQDAKLGNQELGDRPLKKGEGVTMRVHD